MMSKLLAFAFFGAAAASNTTTNGTTTVTQSSSNLQTGNVVDDSTFSGTAGKNLVEMDVTIGLELPVAVTSAMMLDAANVNVVSMSTACNAAAADTALKVTCDVANGLKVVLDGASGVSVSEVTVLKVSAGRRRSLTETEARRLTLTDLKFESSVEVTDAEMGGFLKTAVASDGALNAAGFATALKAAFDAASVTYGTPTASAVVGKVCTGASCEDAVAATPAPSVTSTATTSDAIKTGLGLAAAVVSGLFLF